MLAEFARVPGKLGVPTTTTPFFVVIIFPTSVTSQLPPTSAFMSTTTAPDLNFDMASSGTVIGAGRPKILAVVTIMSASDATSHTVSFTF